MSTVANASQGLNKDLGYKVHSIGGFRFERDEYFEVLIRNSWHFSGLESWSASSANPTRRRYGENGDYYDDNNRNYDYHHGERGRSGNFNNNNNNYGPRSSYDNRNSPRSSPNRPMSPGRTSSPPPATYYQGRTDRPLNY